MSYDLYSPYLTQPQSPYLPPPQVAHVGWHDASQIDTLDGLATGTFYWPEPQFTSRQITFTPGVPLFGEPFGGTYAIGSGLGPPEEVGSYGHNAAPLTPVHLRLLSTGGFDRSFDVDGMFTMDAGERIQFLLLRGLMSAFISFRTS